MSPVIIPVIVHDYSGNHSGGNCKPASASRICVPHLRLLIFPHLHLLIFPRLTLEARVSLCTLSFYVLLSLGFSLFLSLTLSLSSSLSLSIFIYYYILWRVREFHGF